MKRVLVCVLDWGLGHATRSIPVIHELLRQGAEVLLASSGTAGSLLKVEFPKLPFHELPGYRPIYSKVGLQMTSMLAQLPKFYQVARDEQTEVEQLVRNFQLDAVISDNRYGCYSRYKHSVLITHQEVVRLMPGFGFMERIVNSWLQRYYNQFDELWNPDEPGSGLTGPFVSGKRPVQFIGWLSRFPMGSKPAKKLPIMAVVSGPEPQRTLLEERLREQLRARQGKSLLVTGQPDKQIISYDGNVEIVSHLPAAQMESRLMAADLVIARSGYSTIMDLIALGKRAAFIPTPLQPEQLYLADHLKRKGIAFCQDQDTFAVDTLVSESSRYTGWPQKMPDKTRLEGAVRNLLRPAS